jgi:hypothetical protein
MGTTYAKVSEVCSKYNLSLVDFSAFQLLNSWSNKGQDLEKTISEMHQEAKQYQLPFTVELDELGLNEAMTRLSFDKEYSSKMLEFYNKTIIPESQKKTGFINKLRRELYYNTIF